MEEMLLIKVLRNNSFKYMFFGRFVTNLGDSLYFVAAMWLVFDLTNDPLFSGIAAALILVPQSFQFLVGPLVDKWPLRKIMVHTQLIQFLLVLTIPLAHYVNILNVWLVITVMVLAVTVEQFVYPAHYAAMPKILKKDELVSGNSLLTFSQQGSDFILTGLSGLIIIYIGAVNIYLIDSITFLLAAFLFNKVKLNEETTPQPQGTNEAFSLKNNLQSYKSELSEGFKLIKDSFIPKILIPILIANFLFGMLNAILPAYSNFRGGEAFYGYFLAAMAVGMLLGSLVAPKVEQYSFGKIMMTSFFLLSGFWFISGWIGNSILSVIFFGVAVIPLGVTNVLIFSLFQTIIPEDILGRAESIISSITSLSLPIGAFLGGYLASILGPSAIFTGASLSGLFLLIYWLVSRDLREMPVLSKMKPEDYIYHSKVAEPAAQTNS
jgi:MFS family permease